MKRPHRLPTTFRPTPGHKPHPDLMVALYSPRSSTLPLKRDTEEVRRLLLSTTNSFRPSSSVKSRPSRTGGSCRPQRV